MESKTSVDQTVLLLNAANWHVERSAERADLGDLVGAQRHRTIANHLVSQLRKSSDAGRRLAEAMRVMNE